MATATPIATRPCCRSCQLRFTVLASTYLTACPECDAPLIAADSPASLVGFQLFDPLGLAATLPEALAVALPTRPIVSDRPERRP